MLRPVANAAALIACVLAAGEVQDRQRAADRMDAFTNLVALRNPKPRAQDPVKSVTELYRLTPSEFRLYDILRKQGLSQEPAAQAVVRLRQSAPPDPGAA